MICLQPIIICDTCGKEANLYAVMPPGTALPDRPDDPLFRPFSVDDEFFQALQKYAGKRMKCPDCQSSESSKDGQTSLESAVDYGAQAFSVRRDH